MFWVGNKRRRRKRAKKRKTTKPKSFSILVEAVNTKRQRTLWYKIDFALSRSSMRRMKVNFKSPNHFYETATDDTTEHDDKKISASLFLITDTVVNFSYAAVIGTNLYTILDNKLVFCEVDAIQLNFSWTPIPSSPCITPLIWNSYPTLVTHNGRLYIFGCKNNVDDASSNSQLGFMYDPQHDSWGVIIKPNAEYPFLSNFVAVSLYEGLILLMHRHLWVYDMQSRKWISPSPYCLLTDYVDTGEWVEYTTGFPSDMPSMIGNLVVVEQESTMYWISDTGHIYAYNWETLETLCGPIVGLEQIFFLDLIVEGNKDVPLFHLKGDLFCLLYQDPISDSHTSNLHCLIAQVIKRKSSVSMAVIGCFCAPVPNNKCTLHNPVLMCQGD